MTAGDVIAEVDAAGRFVDLWLVVQIELRADGIYPQKVRRACRPRAAVEPWSGIAWRPASLHHRFARPPEGA